MFPKNEARFITRMQENIQGEYINYNINLIFQYLLVISMVRKTNNVKDTNCCKTF